MDHLITNPYFLSAYFGGIAGLFCLTTLRRWYHDYSPPSYRQHRFDEPYGDVPEWKVWFAWRPVRTISGRVMWWETVYRNIGNGYVDYDDWRWYHYGDITDVLRNPG